MQEYSFQTPDAATELISTRKASFIIVRSHDEQYFLRMLGDQDIQASSVEFINCDSKLTYIVKQAM